MAKNDIHTISCYGAYWGRFSAYAKFFLYSLMYKKSYVKEIYR